MSDLGILSYWIYSWPFAARILGPNVFRNGNSWFDTAFLPHCLSDIHGGCQSLFRLSRYDSAADTLFCRHVTQYLPPGRPTHCKNVLAWKYCYFMAHPGAIVAWSLHTRSEHGSPLPLHWNRHMGWTKRRASGHSRRNSKTSINEYHYTYTITT